MHSSKDAAYGAVLGAFVGDAAGAVLEFMRHEHITAEDVEAAMKMPGGGVHNVGPGQITDDSEMALSLAHALSENAPPIVPIDKIARKYGDWYASGPFDIGCTCAVVQSANDRQDNQGLGYALMHAAFEHNNESKANGALMRITPMAVWGHRLPAAQLAQAACDDARLTHCNPTCQAANAAYCLAIAHLILHPGDAPGAVHAARLWLTAAPGPTIAQGPLPRDHEAALSEGKAEVLLWLDEAAKPGPGPGVHALMGFVRWGFTHAFRHLILRSSYEESIKAVLMLGGDTDTNAAIVGGLLGALHGASAIPDHMKVPVLARTTASPGTARRPDWLQSSLLPAVFEKVYAQACSVEPQQQEL